MELTDIISCIAGVLALVISVVSIVLSTQATRQQVKIDLFNRRYEVYVICRVICGSCSLNMPDLVEERLDEMNINFEYFEIEGAKYLFNKKTYDRISDIVLHWLSYNDIYYAIKDYELSKNGNKKEYQDDKMELERLIEYFKIQEGQLDLIFNKFLKI